MSEDSPFSSAGDVLEKLYARISPSPEAMRYADLHTAWKDIAGQEMSFHVIPQDIVNKTLLLEADHPGWIQKVQMVQGKLMQSINKRYPDLNIKKIRVVYSKGTT